MQTFLLHAVSRNESVLLSNGDTSIQENEIANLESNFEQISLYTGLVRN